MKITTKANEVELWHLLKRILNTHNTLLCQGHKWNFHRFSFSCFTQCCGEFCVEIHHECRFRCERIENKIKFYDWIQTPNYRFLCFLRQSKAQKHRVEARNGRTAVIYRRNTIRGNMLLKSSTPMSHTSRREKVSVERFTFFYLSWFSGMCVKSGEELAQFQFSSFAWHCCTLNSPLDSKRTHFSSSSSSFMMLNSFIERKKGKNSVAM